MRAVYTIGFTRKTAAEFFGALTRAGAKRLVDVRLNNSSQLAGFTRRADLPFFLEQICGAEYIHEPLLAPTPELLAAHRGQRGTWAEYEASFLELMRQRRVEQRVPRQLFDVPAVLLCSEPTPEHCHRRLVVEYLQSAWGDLQPVHL